MTSHPKADGLHVYANKKGKAYTETSTTEAKDDVLVGSAAKQAVKERGEHAAALRQLQQESQTVLHSKQIQIELSRKQSSLLMEDGKKLHDDNQCIKENHKENGLCLFEHVTGQPMSNENLTSDSLVQTDERLSLAVHNAKNQVLAPPKGGHGIVPNKWVKIQKTDVSQEYRWERPTEDLLVSDAAVKALGNNEWIDVNLPRDEG